MTSTMTMPASKDEFLAEVAPRPTQGAAFDARSTTDRAAIVRSGLVAERDRLAARLIQLGHEVANLIADGGDPADLLAASAVCAADLATVIAQLDTLNAASRLLGARSSAVHRTDPAELEWRARSAAASSGHMKAMNRAEAIHAENMHKPATTFATGRVERERLVTESKKINRTRWDELREEALTGLLFRFRPSADTPDRGSVRGRRKNKANA